MAKKDPEQIVSEEHQADASSKKRKSALDEIQVDLSLPEPPSKKARRALKKGKTLPAKPKSDDEEDGEDEKTEGAKDSKKKKERSPYGVWIGNLRFTVTKPELRKWLVDNSGGSITDESITRVHMPMTKPAAGPGPKKAPENRGFAYVDFATFDANVAAIALSETEWYRRKLLIKDSKSFEGRPKKEEPAPVAADGTTSKGAGSDGKAGGPSAGASTKIFVGNMSFNTTEDDLHAHFEKCGKIRWIKVATFEDSGKCKGYGWVNFEDAESAAWAVKGFVKVRETVETLEDFMDVDEEDTKPTGEGETDGESNGESKPSNDSNEESSGDEDDDDDDETNETPKKKPQKPTTTKEPARIRTRKWWVNQLLGRNLKIELAEDDQTRYHKRFGKGATAARRQQQQEQQSDHNSGNDPRQGGAGRRDRDRDGNGEQQQGGKEQKAIKYQADVSVARLTGAPVAHQGKKVTFD